MDALEKKLVEANVGLAKTIAKEMWAKAPDALDLDELTSLTFEGLIQSATKWREKAQPEKLESNEDFVRYASPRMRGSVLDHLKKPEYVQRSYREIYNLLLKVGYHRGRDMAVSELSDLSGVSPQRIREVVAAVENHPVSLNEAFSGGFDDEITGNEAVSNHDVEQSAIIQIIQREVVLTIQGMQPAAQVIYALRYYSGLEFRDIAAELGVSRTYVWTLHQEALLQIHSAIMSKVREVNA